MRLALLSFSIILAALFFGTGTPNDYSMDWYDEAWAKVDSLDQQGLPKSALDVVTEIRDRALSDKNEPHLIKSLLYQSRYRLVLEEEVVDPIFADLSAHLDGLSDPSRAVLHSVIADVYWQYFQTNRYQFYNRTAGGAPDNSSIETWDVPKIIGTALNHYRASLSDPAILKTIDVSAYEPIVSLRQDSRTLRPTLFDFLAHRALDVLENGESALVEPVNAFRLDLERDLAPAASFIAADVSSTDSLSMQSEVLRIYQALLRLHADDPDPAALVHSDLRRLQYVRGQLSNDRVRDRFIASLEELAARVREFPAYTDVRFAQAREIDARGAEFNPLSSDDYKWDRKTAFEICADAVESFPASKGAINCRGLQVGIEQKELNVQAQGVLIPGAESFMRVQFRNVSELHIRIVELTRERVREWQYTNARALTQLTDRLLNETAVYDASVSLPTDGDLQSHTTLVNLPALPMGQYGLIIGTSPKFLSEGHERFGGTVIASNLSYIVRREPDGANRLYVMDRDSGHPGAGATVTGFARTNQGGANASTGSSKTSDANGMVIFRDVDNRYDNLEVTLGDDWLYSQSGLYPNRRYGRNDEYNETKFFTDRAIYRPGQTVYFKGILLKRADEKYEIRPNAATTVVFRDVNRRQLASLDLTSNQYGTVSGEFVAPRGVLTGNMSIEDGSGSTSFSVEEYKRPRFEVVFEPVTEAVALGDTIVVRGNAKSLAGAAIGDGLVQYRVTRSTYFPWWGYRHWRPWPRSVAAEIAYGTATTKPDGTFEVSFLAAEDESLDPSTRPTYNYSVTADVTDIAGETRSAQTSVNAARESVFISLNVADRVDADKPMSFVASANNINGQGLPFSGELTVTRLIKPGLLLPSSLGAVDTLTMTRQEFKRVAPHEAFGREADESTWERRKVVFRTEIAGDGSESVSPGEHVKWEPGAYEVKFVASNDKGLPIQAIRYTTVYASRDDDAPANTLDWFALLTPTVEPGERARYVIGTSERNMRVLVELEHDGKIVQSDWVRLSREQKELSFPVTEAYRGNVAVHVSFAWHNHVFTRSELVSVPWTNKQLSLSWETFRSKLYPGQDETWKLKIAGPKGEAVAAELVATLYDASLDALRPHNWYLNLWPTRGAALYWDTNEFGRQVSFRRDGRNWNERSGYTSTAFDMLNMFGFSWYGGYRDRIYSPMRNAGALDAPEAMMELVADGEGRQMAKAADESAADNEAKNAGAGEPDVESPPTTVRTNLNETAFFFPQLETDQDGATILSFTMPEALTRWRFLGLAITKDLKLGATEGQTVTQKELMVTPNAPRFFRAGDTIFFTAKVDNLTETDLSGTAEIELEDATTGRVITREVGIKKAQHEITIKAGQSTAVEWALAVPSKVNAITYRVKARTDQFADGEESIIPVLTNRMLVTESLPLPMRGPGTRKFRFDKLADHTSTTLVNERFTLEYSPNPIWYAVQALPYLMEFPHECAEQVFSRFYANGIATHIVAAQPKLRAVYEKWKSSDASALMSNLEKNQELKAIMLEEAPWVMQANNESERKRRIGILFDTYRMRGELVGAITKLEQMQRPNGAWPWFQGMEDNRYITQHIVKGIGYLRRIGVLEAIDDGRPLDQANRAIAYLDGELVEDYERMVEAGANLETYRTGLLQLHHLYARSFFPELEMGDEYKEVHDYFARQARKYWLEYSYVGQGMIALEAHRTGDAQTADKIVKSLREHSIDNDELGLYWKMDAGYFWYQAPIETQSLLIEVFNEVAQDAASVSAMQLWLLKQKQTQDWKTTKATTDAIYALLMRGTNLMEVEGTVSIAVGSEVVSSDNQDTEEGTGYLKKAWSAANVTASMANITVTKNGDGPAWGAVYWQYFEDLDQITPAETPLKLEKELYVQRQTDAGPQLTRLDASTKLVPGDLIKVRIILKVDRAMEYVHMKDMRSSGFEPVNVLSGYRWQDGLGYYESTRDAATHFFISYLPQGTFVFEYPVRVSHRGDFSNGITSIQSMYAPEFTSHSAGVRVRVGAD